MNKLQKAINKGTKKNIRLYPLELGDSYCKRKRLLKKAVKRVIKRYRKNDFTIEEEYRENDCTCINCAHGEYFQTAADVECFICKLKECGTEEDWTCEDYED